MSLTLDDVIHYLEGLSGEELGQLADEVLARIGAPPVVLPRRPPSTTMGIEIGWVGFDVVLTDPGPNKAAVIVALRQTWRLAMGLQEVKKLVERAPVTLFEQLSKSEAEERARELRALGAVVELR